MYEQTTTSAPISWRRLFISVQLSVEGSSGPLELRLTSFVDSGSDTNVLSAYVATEHRLRVDTTSRRVANVMGGGQVPLLGTCDLVVSLTNRHGDTRSVRMRADVVEERRYPLIQSP